jgi:hypothetical protein
VYDPFTHTTTQIRISPGPTLHTHLGRGIWKRGFIFHISYLESFELKNGSKSTIKIMCEHGMWNWINYHVTSSANNKNKHLIGTSAQHNTWNWQSYPIKSALRIRTVPVLLISDTYTNNYIELYIYFLNYYRCWLVGICVRCLWYIDVTFQLMPKKLLKQRLWKE